MRFSPFLIAVVSLVAAYVGVLLVSLQLCDKNVDPLAANPFEPALLFGVDLVAAVMYGAVLVLLGYGLSVLVNRMRLAINRRLAFWLVYLSPVGITAAAVIIVYSSGSSAQPGCRP